ncbi:hypothetical protein F5148DRAFT_1213857, partial [Russula earlei]
MTNWHDPSVILAESIALMKSVHVIGGLYIWEYVQSLEYEFSLITGKRKFIRTSPIYIGGRLFALLLIISEFVSMDMSHGMSCQLAVNLAFVLAALALLSASTLVSLRAYALWEQNKVVLVFASTLWLANASTYLYIGITKFQATDVDGACVFAHSSLTSVFIMSTFVADFLLLALMFAGVQRWYNLRGTGGVWQLLYKQGLAWVVLFTFSGLPSVVSITLNLNDTMARMFLVPQIISTTICASRMHLGLLNRMTTNIVLVESDTQQPAKGRIQSSAPPHRIHFAEGTYGTAGERFTSIAITPTTPQESDLVLQREKSTSFEAT